MASSLSPPTALNIRFKSLKRIPRQTKVRSQCFKDEGRSRDIVDANMRVLRERIEKVKVKEKFERCYRFKYGWNYASGYNYERKRQANLLQLFELLRLVVGTVSLTCLGGTILLYLVSLFLHLNH